MKKRLTILLLVILTILFASCNTENEGLFMRISNSVEKDDVGWVDIIAKNGDLIYAMTEHKGFSSYNVANGKWSKIDVSNKPIRNYAFDSVSNKILLITGDSDKFYSFKIDDQEIKVLALDKKVKTSKSQSPFILVEENNTTYSVYSFDGATLYKEKDGIDFTSTQLITSSSEWVISGLKNSKYYTYYNNAETELTKGNPIVAFSDKLVSVDSKGNVYKDGTFDETNTKITLFDRKQDYFRYPSFERNDKLYIQDRSYDFWTIAADGTKAKAEAKFDDISKKNIRVMSYLADNNTIYLGTYANGIWTVKLD